MMNGKENEHRNEEGKNKRINEANHITKEKKQKKRKRQEKRRMKLEKM